jgi:ActR/RegA family two-component response regulator
MTKQRVLVVDDIKSMRERFAQRVESLGVDVETAATEKEAVEKIRHKTYHLALVDVMLTDDENDRGGFEVVKAIFAAREGTQVIVMSATEDVRVPVEAWNQGAIRYLIKADIQSTDDFLKEVKSGLAAATIKNFGKFNSLTAYLGYPEQNPYWETALFQCLGGSYGSVMKRLDALFGEILPVLRPKTLTSTLQLDAKAGTAAGLFWSKALGAPIWVAVGKAHATLPPPPAGCSEQIDHHDGRDLISTTWKLNSPTRDAFQESLWL